MSGTTVISPWERLVIEQLLKGPSSSGAYATIPANTKILSVSTRDQICYVNFDQELMNMKSNVKPEILIYIDRQFDCGERDGRPGTDFHQR